MAADTNSTLLPDELTGAGRMTGIERPSIVRQHKNGQQG
jgi:hypothetical protein